MNQISLDANDISLITASSLANDLLLTTYDTLYVSVKTLDALYTVLDIDETLNLSIITQDKIYMQMDINEEFKAGMVGTQHAI